MAPRLSIVIATYNAAATLRGCLDSILSQAYGDLEILIADGGSTDGTLFILEEYSPHLAWWRSRPDAGIYDAWNDAIDNASGEYVAFIGADDLWHDNSVLQGLFQAIDGHEFDLVTGRGELIDSSGRRHTFGRAWDFARVARRMTICHPGALHRRDLFARYGRFDTRYRISADYEFLLRLPAQIRTFHVPWTLVDVADGGISRRGYRALLMERFRIQARCPRVGTIRALLNLLDKLWRIPVARVLRIPN